MYLFFLANILLILVINVNVDQDLSNLDQDSSNYDFVIQIKKFILIKGIK